MSYARSEWLINEANTTAMAVRDSNYSRKKTTLAD
jgi:hypothetical protein